MKKVMVSVTYRLCEVGEFLAVAKAGAGSSAWVLFETAKKAGLMRLGELKDADIAAEASRLIVFSEKGEYRLEKAFLEVQGNVRILEIGTAGSECHMREQEYLLRKDAGAKGRLLCREFYCPDENGMLKLYCECLVGVKED